MSQTDNQILDMQIAMFTQNHNMHLLAMTPIISFLKDVQEYDNLEDIQNSTKTILYDMTCLENALHDNADVLWELKSQRDALTTHN